MTPGTRRWVYAHDHGAEPEADRSPGNGLSVSEEPPPGRAAAGERCRPDDARRPVGPIPKGLVALGDTLAPAGEQVPVGANVMLMDECPITSINSRIVNSPERSFAISASIISDAYVWRQS